MALALTPDPEELISLTTRWMSAHAHSLGQTNWHIQQGSLFPAAYPTNMSTNIGIHDGRMTFNDVFINPPELIDMFAPMGGMDNVADAITEGLASFSPLVKGPTTKSMTGLEMGVAAGVFVIVVLGIAGWFYPKESKAAVKAVSDGIDKVTKKATDGVDEAVEVVTDLVTEITDVLETNFHDVTTAYPVLFPDHWPPYFTGVTYMCASVMKATGLIEKQLSQFKVSFGMDAVKEGLRIDTQLTAPDGSQMNLRRDVMLVG